MSRSILGNFQKLSKLGKIMELESHFFNDSIFDIEKQDYWVLERSYVYQQEGVHTGWYKPYVEKLIKRC